MKNVGRTFFWVLGGIPKPKSNRPIRVLHRSVEVMAKSISEPQRWQSTPGRKIRRMKRATCAPLIFRLLKSLTGWDISLYRDKELIENVRNTKQSKAIDI